LAIAFIATVTWFQGMMQG